jgi:hypothetical protein
MKKLYIVFCLLIASYTSHSQSLSATNVFVTGDPAFFLEGHATINNISGSSKDVYVQRTVNNLATGHNSYFCWVQCYTAQVSVSPDFITLAPGANTDVFRGDLETNSEPGNSNVTYCFYNANNTADSVCVEFNYVGPVGLNDLTSGKNYISKAYPNPAIGGTTNFYVNLAKGVKSAKLKFFNLLGTEVKEISVIDGKNPVKVNVSDLKSGIYFYSLWVDGKSTVTSKLMVSKN